MKKDPEQAGCGYHLRTGPWNPAPKGTRNRHGTFYLLLRAGPFSAGCFDEGFALIFDPFWK